MEVTLLYQIIAIVGALSCLSAFVAHQFRWMNAERPLYNLLNFTGGAMLGYAALNPFQAGFVLMEFTWAGVGLYGLIRSLRPLKDDRSTP